MTTIKIKPVIKHYKWGDDTFIPSLLGLPVTGEPCGELWFGTHSNGEATLPDGSLLSHLLQKEAPTYLGKGQGDLPFLLKVLSIAQPLSLQVHPSVDQAQAGWAKEAPLRGVLKEEELNYKDPHQKAEVLYALTPVTALYGFLPIEEIEHNFKEIFPSALIEGLFKSLKHFFAALYALDKTTLNSLLNSYKTYLKGREVNREGQWLTREGIGQTCLKLYPHDVGVLAPYFMNTLHLKPGEAIYLAPRTLHAYVKGHGIELMSNSDNVLRGGLTTKKVDTAELMEILEFSSVKGELAPQRYDEAGCLNVIAPTDDFMLGVFKEGSYTLRGQTAIELLFSVQGESILSKDREEVVIKRGECLVVPALMESYTLKVQGELFRATLPPNKGR